MPPAPPRVTFGHAKNHRSDLKQILYGTLMTADGGIPLMGKGLDGNKSDNHAAAEFFGRVRKLVENPRNVCCIADSKGWCARVLHLAQKENLRILSRLPRTHKLHEHLMAKKWRPEGKIEIPARGKRQKADVYEFMGFDVEEILTLDTTAAEPNSPKTYVNVDVPARAVRIFSTALLRTKMKSLERIRIRESKAATVCIGKWQNSGYACEIDAQRASERHCLEHGWVTLNLHPTLVSVTGPMKPRPGRPSSRAETPLTNDHYRITYTTSPVTKSVSERRLHHQSTFILIRTRNAGWNIADGELIPRYKGLYHNEHGFAWLKSGASLNPVFLHTEERIASLCFIYCIGLMAWSLIQREVRKTLKATNTMLPYHRGKPSNMITTRFFFELFAQVQVVPYRMADGPEKKDLAGFEGTVEAACRAAGTTRRAFTPR
jgi:transposase